MCRVCWDTTVQIELQPFCSRLYNHVQISNEASRFVSFFIHLKLAIASANQLQKEKYQVEMHRQKSICGRIYCHSV